MTAVAAFLYTLWKGLAHSVRKAELIGYALENKLSFASLLHGLLSSEKTSVKAVKHRRDAQNKLSGKNQTVILSCGFRCSCLSPAGKEGSPGS